MRPKNRIPFQEWIKVLNNRKILTSENFFDKRKLLYDAIPACWKNLSVFNRRAITDILDDIYNSTQTEKSLWTSANILKLTKYIKLDEVFKLCSCFKTVNNESDEKVGADKTAVDHFYSWKPSKLIYKYKRNSTCT